MSKIKICKHTIDFDHLAKALKENKIDFKKKDCIHKCSKCRNSLVVKRDDEYISGKNIQKLLEKLKEK